MELQFRACSAVGTSTICSPNDNDGVLLAFKSEDPMPYELLT